MNPNEGAMGSIGLSGVLFFVSSFPFMQTNTTC